MTRTSGNEYRDGSLYNGYDYDKQTWVIKGKYARCGHPDNMRCACYGRLHENEVVSSSK